MQRCDSTKLYLEIQLNFSMERKPILCLFILLYLIELATPNSGHEDFRLLSLVKFMQSLSPDDSLINDKGWGWNTSSDPCDDGWKGVTCDVGSRMIRKVVLDGLNLTGTLDAGSLCKGVGSTLFVVSLIGNQLKGEIPSEIARCDNLNHLYLTGNRFSGELPASLSHIKGLKRFEVSDNNFTGKLPSGLAKIPGMLSFLAQNNRISGNLPEFDLDRFEEFNVSNNELSGAIPRMGGHFRANSFLGNLDLCGKPLDKECPPTSSSNITLKDWSVHRYLIYAGYALIGLVVIMILSLKLVSNMRRREPNKGDVRQNVSGGEDGSIKADDLKISEYKSQYSMESGALSSVLVILDDRLAKGLKFEDLLRAPAELLGRGNHGTLYKVILDDGAALTVKRIKSSGIQSDEFTRRMHSINKVRNRRVLPVIAFYSSKQEKLLVYEHQPNGSLFKLLHGSENEQIFAWGSRLVAATSVADALAYMHKGLGEDGIPHGNLKSTNILFDKDKDACISEYGLTRAENERRIHPYGPKSLKMSGSTTKDCPAPTLPRDDFKEDVYDFGLILLEILTGRMTTDNGLDLARWVNSMVREEWTGEVFDRALMNEGVSEERMVNLLQVAIKCTSASPAKRPDMIEVSRMIGVINEEEEKSSINTTFSFTGDSVSM